MDAHHDAVRRNMLFLVGVEKDRIVEASVAKRKQQQERDELESDDNFKGAGGAEIGVKEINDILENLRASPTEGSHVKDYEVQRGELAFRACIPALQGDADGDTEMDRTDSQATRDPRSEMVREIHALLVRAAEEMRLYNIHAAASRKKYEDTLERQLRQDSGEIPNTASATPATGSEAFGTASSRPAGGSAAGSRRGSGILLNWNEPGPVDMEALARMDLETLEEAFSVEHPGLGRTVVDKARDPRRRNQ